MVAPHIRRTPGRAETVALILKSVDGPPARGPAWPLSGSRLVEGSCALPLSQQAGPRDGPVMSLLSPPPLTDATSTDDSEMRTTKLRLLCTAAVTGKIDIIIGQVRSGQVYYSAKV
jgi:hypothetical protein